jgi:Tfp pilus assembly protein PilF
MKRPNKANGPPAAGKPPPATGFFEKLVSVLPSITQPIQLLGLAITVAGFVIVHLVSPDNVAAMLSAGMIGVGLIIFATLFLIIPQIAKQHRALFILLLFFMYIGASIYLVKITYDLIRSGAQRVTEESLKVVAANLSAREQDLSDQIDKAQRRLTELQTQRGRSESLREVEEIDDMISKSRSDISDSRRLLEGVRARQQSLRDTPQLIGNVVAELNRLEREYGTLNPQNPDASKLATAATDAARGELDQAQRLLEERLFNGKQDEGRTKLALGEIAEVKGDLGQALQYYRDADRLLATNLVAAEYHARVCRLLGYFAESRTTYEHALDLVGPKPSDYRQSLLTDYAVSLWHLGAQEAREKFQTAYDGTAPLTLPRALAAQSFGAFLWDMDELAPAEDKLREADTIYRQLEVTKQFLRNEALNNLGGVLLARGKYVESRQYLEASRSLIAQTIGVTNLAYSQTVANLVENYSRFGDPSNADEYVQFLLKRESEGGFAGYELSAILGAVAEYFNEKMDFKQTDDVLRRAFGILSRMPDIDTSTIEASTVLKGKIAMKQIEASLDAGLIDVADRQLTENSDLLRVAVKSKTRGEVQLERIRGRISLARSDLSKAICHLKKAVSLADEIVGPDHPSLVWSLVQLAQSYRRTQQDSKTASDEAKQILERAVQIAKRSLSSNSRIWLQLTDKSPSTASPT